jgi:pimeloyl-ACP methyl ester carboxylesterase
MVENVPIWARNTFQEKSVRLGGERIPYLLGGEGPALLMLHGLTASLDWWRYNAIELAQHFTVYMVDLPGFGRLGHLPTSGSMPRYTEWVYRLMISADLEHAHVLGHSMGGHIATRLAAGFPEQVDKLILVSPVGALPDAELEHYVMPVLKLIRELPPRLIPLALRDIRRTDLRTAWKSGQNLIEDDILHLMKYVQASTLIIWGEEDDIVSFELADVFLDNLPQARLITFPGIRHLPMIDDAARFNREVTAFLTWD